MIGCFDFKVLFKRLWCFNEFGKKRVAIRVESLKQGSDCNSWESLTIYMYMHEKETETWQKVTSSLQSNYDGVDSLSELLTKTTNLNGDAVHMFSLAYKKNGLQFSSKIRHIRHQTLDVKRTKGSVHNVLQCIVSLPVLRRVDLDIGW